MGQRLDEVFVNVLKQTLRAQTARAESELFGNRERLLTAVVTKVQSLDADWDRTIDNRPAKDVLVDRLGRLPDPELQLVASVLVSRCEPSVAAQRWLAAAEQLASTGC